MTKTISIKAALALGALALSALLIPTPSARAEGTWCAEAGGRGGYSNCGYYSFRQCLAAISGVGGTCRPNPYVETYVVVDEDGERIYRRVYR